MFLKEYQCTKCGNIQEVWLNKSSDENNDKCEKCEAEAKELKPILSYSKKHVSWSLW